MYRNARSQMILSRCVAIAHAVIDDAQPKEDMMAASPTPDADPIRVGVIADLTGPLSFVGLANANVARMVVGDLNAKGGLLGRQLELYVEDSATDDAAAAVKA